MGLLDLFGQSQTPTVQTILPQVAVNEILAGRLPVLTTDKVFLKGGETCHYIDKAVYDKKVVQKRYVRRNGGYSAPGLFKGTRVAAGGGHTDVTDRVTYESQRGILYVTNRRIIFQGEKGGFDVKLGDLVAIQPYANCVELQCSKNDYTLYVPDGRVAHAVLKLVR